MIVLFKVGLVKLLAERSGNTILKVVLGVDLPP
jgi:hypothetical protein